MATLENFDARSLALDFSPLLQIKQALDLNKNRQLAERKLALDEEIRRGTLGVAEADLILRQEAGDLASRKFESTQTSQQSIQDTLAQLINPPQTQADQIVPGQIIQADLGAIPTPQPRTVPAVNLAKREELLLKLSGIKGGPAIVKAIEPIFAGRDKRAKEALAKQVDETQAFALSLSRMDSREKQDKAIDNEIAKQSRTGEVDPSLIQIRNMNDADREQELFLDIAQGDVLKDLAKNELVAPVVKPVDKFEDVLGPDGKIIAQKNLRTGEVKKSPLATGGRAEKATFAKSPGVIVELPDGSFAQSIPVIDTRTGETVNKIVPLEGQPVSRLGETGEALTVRKIRQAGGITRTKAQQTRIQVDIDDAISAAKGMAVVNRSIKLLDDLETGGFDAIKVRVKQTLGVESANEAELTANLGKQVLAQLRPIFGSQFTEREGATLTRIEAGFGKSTKGNIRLLNQLKQLIQRAAKRGIAAAKDTDDFRSALDIQDLLEFTLQDVAPETITNNGGEIGAGEFNFNPTTGKLEPVGGSQ